VPAVPLRPRRLLAHATALAEHQSHTGRPVVTWLRRSTSAAYYALFHGVSLAVVEQIAPSLAQNDQYRLARSINHGRVADVFHWVSGEGTSRKHARPILADLRENVDVRHLAGIFVRLQQARHDADYDHLARFRKATTLTHIEQATRGLDLLDALTGTADGERLFALVALHADLH
jgi:hypothetical protein